MNESTELSEEIRDTREVPETEENAENAAIPAETESISPASVSEDSPEEEADTVSGNDHEDGNDQDTQTDVEMSSDNESSSENKEDFSAPEEEIPEGETRASYNLKKIIAAEGERKEAYQQNKEELLSKMKSLIEAGHHEEQAE